MRCLRCDEEIIRSFAKPGEVTRCRNCGARQILPNSDGGGDWVEQSRELQREDDVRYQRLMPWAFRFWAVFMSTFYMRFRIDNLRETGGLSETTLAGVIDHVLSWGMVSTGVLALGWAYYAQVRCYGIPYNIRTAIGYLRSRWIAEAAVIIAGIVLLGEMFNYLL